MSKNTSISLGDYFDKFIHKKITEGRYKNVSEVIRAGLRLLEEEEHKIVLLRNAIKDGIDIGISDDSDSKKQFLSNKNTSAKE